MTFPPDSPPSPPPGHALDRPAVLAALRARIARLDRSGARAAAGDSLPLCDATDSLPLCDAIDQRLPGGGLARAAVHEVLAADPGAAAGFCGLLLARARGTVLWIAAEPDAWPPGLARFGLSPADLVLVQAPRRQDALWAMEESLRCPGVAGALLAVDGLDLTAARRLQLAAEAGGAIGLLLCPDTGEAGGATAALTRWRVGALAGTASGIGSAHDLGDPRWSLELLRGRGARPQRWEVVWRPALDRLDLDDAGVEADERDAEVETVTLHARRRAR
ncbi:ImuA family protein [Dankookia sp. GCM10030260]|uniref:ImuA family protein n=1 Tax=Dankookia sp. GCM10030260 TaxID=3273390 RepID=UPI003622A00C